MITKLEAARQLLDAAIHLLDEEDLAAHALAYQAYCLLRDKFGPGGTVDLLKKVEKALNLREIPEYLKHSEYYPEAILKEHSPETAHAIIALSIRLWIEHGEDQTERMRAFALRPIPYEPELRHAVATEVIAKGGDIAKAASLTRKSTGNSPVEHGPRRSSSSKKRF